MGRGRSGDGATPSFLQMTFKAATPPLYFYAQRAFMAKRYQPRVGAGAGPSGPGTKVNPEESARTGRGIWEGRGLRKDF